MARQNPVPVQGKTRIRKHESTWEVECPCALPEEASKG